MLTPPLWIVKVLVLPVNSYKSAERVTAGPVVMACSIAALPGVIGHSVGDCSEETTSIPGTRDTIKAEIRSVIALQSNAIWLVEVADISSLDCLELSIPVDCQKSAQGIAGWPIIVANAIGAFP